MVSTLASSPTKGAGTSPVNAVVRETILEMQVHFQSSDRKWTCLFVHRFVCLNASFLCGDMCARSLQTTACTQRSAGPLPPLTILPKPMRVLRDQMSEEERQVYRAIKLSADGGGAYSCNPDRERYCSCS